MYDKYNRKKKSSHQENLLFKKAAESMVSFSHFLWVVKQTFCEWLLYAQGCESKINSLIPETRYSKQNIPAAEDGLNITWIFLVK